MHLLATKPKGGSYDNLINCALGVVFVGRWRLGILPLASVAVYKSPTSLPGFLISIFGMGLNASFTITGGALQVLSDAVFTGLSGWLNGIRDMGVFQPSFHDQRKGTRACSPLTGSSSRSEQESVGLVLSVRTKKQMNRFVLDKSDVR
jgi:hypothetical protein